MVLEYMPEASVPMLVDTPLVTPGRVGLLLFCLTPALGTTPMKASSELNGLYTGRYWT